MVFLLKKFVVLSTSHEQSSSTLSEEKQDVHIFILVSKQRKWKNIKKRGYRALFRNLPNIYGGALLQIYNGYIIDVWQGSIYAPDVLQDCKDNLKWMNTKML